MRKDSMTPKKKKYVVMAREGDVTINGLDVGSRHINFNGKSGLLVSDPALANDIDKVHGLKGSGKVWVEEDSKTSHIMAYRPDGVHGYFFGSPNKRYRDNYERIFSKKRVNVGDMPEVLNAIKEGEV